MKNETTSLGAPIWTVVAVTVRTGAESTVAQIKFPHEAHDVLGRDVYIGWGEGGGSTNIRDGVFHEIRRNL